MQRSLERFQISPEEYFADLDRTLADARTGLAALDRRMDELTELCGALARARVSETRLHAPPVRWSYDSRLPNYLFDDVFEPEAVEGGAKRWVGRSGRIAATLHLPRHVQYDLAIQIADFAGDAAARSFYLRIDGEQFPWLSHEGKRYASMTLSDGTAGTLTFEIGVDPATIGADSDVSFSFRSIDVARR
jgi:hypothetical protein